MQKKSGCGCGKMPVGKEKNPPISNNTQNSKRKNKGNLVKPSREKN